MNGDIRRSSRNRTMLYSTYDQNAIDKQMSMLMRSAEEGEEKVVKSKKPNGVIEPSDEEVR